MKGTALAVSLIVLLGTAVGVMAGVGGGDVAFPVKAAGDVVFSHGGHVEGAGLKCTDCHDALYVTAEKHKAATMAEMQAGMSCGACHDGKRAFSVKADCSRCHKK